MDKDEFTFMEVKPNKEGWYFITLFQFKKERISHPDYIKDWMFYNGESWNYGLYEGCCYVCFIEDRHEN